MQQLHNSFKKTSTWMPNIFHKIWKKNEETKKNPFLLYRNIDAVFTEIVVIIIALKFYFLAKSRATLISLLAIPFLLWVSDTITLLRSPTLMLSLSLIYFPK